MGATAAIGAATKIAPAPIATDLPGLAAAHSIAVFLLSVAAGCWVTEAPEFELGSSDVELDIVGAA
jgi:hypothetical protein